MSTTIYNGRNGTRTRNQKERKRYLCLEAERKEEGTKELAWYGVGERKKKKEGNVVKQKWKKIDGEERIASRMTIVAATTYRQNENVQ